MQRQANQARPATQAERAKLAAYLYELEFGGSDEADYDPVHMAGIEQAIAEAQVMVFDDYFQHGHLCVVMWSAAYPQLPNHPERFRLSPQGALTLLPHTGRRKYHRAA